MVLHTKEREEKMQKGMWVKQSINWQKKREIYQSAARGEQGIFKGTQVPWYLWYIKERKTLWYRNNHKMCNEWECVCILCDCCVYVNVCLLSERVCVLKYIYAKRNKILPFPPFPVFHFVQVRIFGLFSADYFVRRLAFLYRWPPVSPPDWLSAISVQRSPLEFGTPVGEGEDKDDDEAVEDDEEEECRFGQ